MTVKELIEELSKHPGSYQACYPTSDADGEDGFTRERLLEVEEVRTNKRFTDGAGKRKIVVLV